MIFNKVSFSLLSQFSVLLFLIFVLMACDPNEQATVVEVDETIVGYSTVNLNANRAIIRTQESPLGNLIADAMLEQAQSAGFVVDLALINSGGIRVDLSRHKDGIYPAGDISKQDILDMLPFGNVSVVIELSGMQLKQILERSIAQLPSAGSIPSGAFLQVSSNIIIDIDLTKNAQLQNEEQQIIQAGERVLSININGHSIQPDDTFNLLTSSFVASGGDGYSMFFQIPIDKVTDTKTDMAIYLQQYISIYSPVSPRVENRINILSQ